MRTITLAIAMCLAAGAASADDRKAAADATYRAGEDLYQAKHYLDAAAKFETAYALDPDPAVLFNIAQAYRLGRACAQAARYYHLFLTRVPDPPERDKLDHYITEMDECARREAAASSPQVVHDTQIVHDTRLVRDPGRRQRTLGLVLGAVGVVGLGVGAYLTSDVHQIQSDRESVCKLGCLWGDELATIQRLDDRGHRAEIFEGIVYTTAGAALVTGAVLYVLGVTRHAETISVSPAPGGVAASVRVAF